MDVLSLRKQQILVVPAILAVLAGCSGSSTGAEPPAAALANHESGWAPMAISGPIRAMGAESTKPAMHRDRGSSWMSRAAAAATSLLYVSDLTTNDVFIFNSAGAPVGVIKNGNTGFVNPYGQCVDKTGDVFVAYYISGFPVEYARGATTPRTTFYYSDGDTDGCSIDPTSGNLGVANWDGFYGGSIAVYNAPFFNNQPPSCWYFPGTVGCVKCNPSACMPAPPSSDVNYRFWPPGYDNMGNLYVESYNVATATSQVWELPHGGNSLVAIPTNVTINYPGSVMWDGKYITLTDQDYNGVFQTAIYQMTAPPSGGLTTAGTTVLTDTCNNNYVDVAQPFIAGKKNTPVNKTQGTDVVGGNLDCTNRFDEWAYTAGGNPTATLPGAPAQPSGQSVSVK